MVNIVYSRLVIAAALAFSVVCLAHPGVADGQQAVQTTLRAYRGSIGNSHIEMRLSIEGNNVTGIYSYDSIGEDLKLTGHLDDQGKLELRELDPKGKQTGKFACNRLYHPTDMECTWSKADGNREALVTLEEQHFSFSKGLQIVPKTISNRRSGVGVSYPQLRGSGPLSPAAQNFNRRVLALVQAAIKEFAPIDGHGSFDTNYNVLLGNDDLVSIEMSEFSDGGGAHPNNRFWSLTYDLSENKELKFEDLFKPGSDYKAAIAKYVVADIDRRAVEIEQENARSEGRKPTQRDEPLVSEEQLSELSGWALTPKGLVVYFDFPHVIAFFDRTFIPYSVVNEYLKPNGPATRSNKS